MSLMTASWKGLDTGTDPHEQPQQADQDGYTSPQVLVDAKVNVRELVGIDAP